MGEKNAGWERCQKNKNKLTIISGKDVVLLYPWCGHHPFRLKEIVRMNEQESQEKDQFEQLIQGLIDREYGCLNDFYLPQTTAGLRTNMAHLSELGEMKYAGIGNRKDYQKNKLIRGDQVTWIEENSSNFFELEYLRKIWRLINYMNQTCFTAIKSYESHYANYEVGSFYRRHLDQFKSEKGRQFSIILYLNQGWKEEDEGKLSLYPSSEAEQTVLPLEGRIVFFKSDQMEHEVHPSMTKERKSISGWMKS